MSILGFARKPTPAAATVDPGFLKGWSIEVMPRTLAKVDDIAAILPRGTRVYIAHIEGTPIEDMVATAARLHGAGYDVMPHFPARIIADRDTLADWIARYRGEADVRQALVLAGGVAQPVGAFDSSIALLQTGLFGDFDRIHVAGHPEGNRDIDTDGTTTQVDAALRWKQEFANASDATFAMATQFAFDADGIVAWERALRAAGINMPVHIGIAGPAKLQTMIKFAIACGVGPSLKVLQKRAMDVTKLLLPYEPTEVLSGLAAHKAAEPESLIEQVHFFPLGGIKTNADWAAEHGAGPKDIQ
ncbi:MAG: methylenetetrahydrofolate reductase [Paracoccaceae bacterium]